MAISAYDRNNQIELQGVTIQKPGSSEVLDITALAEQIIIYEDMFQAAISARLIIRDQVNLVGSYPIVGGESVRIKFKTPIYDDYVDQTFIVYALGDRDLSDGQDNIQVNQLMLCTPEVWWSANNNAESAYQGRYSDIITRILSETGTKKSFKNKEDSVGVVSYVAPSTNHFQAIKFCASRANTNTVSPMFFWETLQGYNLKSLKELYRATYDKFIYIEDRNVAGAELDANKAFNTVFSWEYLESNNRLEQFSMNAFSVDYISVDFVNKRILKTVNSYDKLFHENDIKLNKFPLNDDAKSIRNKDTYSPYRQDLSHLSGYNRTASLALMDNLKVLVNIPGDSKLQTGSVVWLEIPSKVGLNIGTEELSSGKWMIRSIKHLITKTTYSMVCELTKDSFDSDVRPQAKK